MRNSGVPSRLLIWGAGLALIFLVGNAQAARKVTYLIVEDKAHPFQIVQGSESRGGIISDMVDAIFAGDEYTVDHQVYPINRLRQVVAKEQVNFWVAYEAVHWHTFGNQGLMVEEPLFNTRHVLLTCREDIPDRITRLEQLRGLNLVMLRGFDYQALDSAIEGGLIAEVPIDRYEAGIQLVAMGRTDGFVEMESRLKYHVRTSGVGNTDCLRWIDFSAIIPNFPLYISVDIDWPPAFRDFIAQRIRTLRASGELERIMDHYLGSDYSPNLGFGTAE
ncbi:substrate-binding periplasmic protein [Marinobacter fonticola]|uniref:substrate-binding periplasmic protein n=1 Tax=Marinobacter fonticola TaxID=2603215 RepID=UPI00143D1CE5|nr:ABC transporter substrate-binding protein [Marinobacter fonticola]